MSEFIEKPELDTSWLPYYQEWKGNGSYGLWDYIINTSNYDVAVAYSKLFCPDFIEVDGLVLLAERRSKLVISSEDYNKLLEEDPTYIESLINHLDIAHFFATRGESIVDGVYKEVFPNELLVYFAQTLLACWKRALTETFPDKSFEFYYNVPPASDSPTISFWQIRD